MKLNQQHIISIIDSRAADIAMLSDSIAMEMAGVSMALDKLRESLDKVNLCLKNREFDKASQVGYEDVARDFVFLQRTLGGLQSVAHEKSAFISGIAQIADAAYEEISPYVEERLLNC